MIADLPAHPDYRPPNSFAGPDHPMRKLTRATAFGEPWTADDAERVASVFDGLAPAWSSDDVDPIKAAPILDALDRGEAPLAGTWVELGSGTGDAARLLHGRVARHVSVDLSEQMLAHAPELSPKVRADSSQLPFGDDTADVVLLINMLLFPDEVDRVLHPSGHVVWVNSIGAQTPIHLPAPDVASALPGEWTGVASNAGRGLWAVLRRV